MKAAAEVAPLRKLAGRVVKFQAVGLIGIGVQLVALALLKSAVGLDYLVATALAVEVTVLHNFCWHERWTWAERTRLTPDAGSVACRLLRFNLTTGLVSILSNLFLMRLFVGVFRLHYLVANMAAIAATFVANFLFSELFAFRAPRS
jgi:putative flippase GtrA